MRCSTNCSTRTDETRPEGSPEMEELPVKQPEKQPMNQIGSLTVTAVGDREIVMTRSFDAPRRLVFEAITKPELVKRWLTGPPGWTMDVCEIDLRVGGRYRYGWQNVDGRTMAMGGVYREIAAPERVVATEKFDDAWYPG